MKHDDFLPASVCEWLSDRFTNQECSVTRMFGGMINTAACLTLSRGAVLFVKWNPAAPAGFFTAEMEGLERLRAEGCIRVCGVFDVVEPDAANKTPFIALPYIPAEQPTDPLGFAQRFGRQIAHLHQKSALQNGGFGLDHDNFIGRLPQINTPHTRWADFYRECRLLPQIGWALEKHLLPPHRERLLNDVVNRLDTLLDDMDEPPCLLHGDLWSGNFLTAGREPVLIDPAVYYSPREMEIAYIELFGGFPAGFLEAYRRVYPLDAGYPRRRPLHQLYPLLNHLNHFGEMYGTRLDETCYSLLSET